MLSIQAHPTLQQGTEGFDREEKAGVPIKSPNRNYKDRNHKPEVHVALTDFWMLHGFRPLEEIADLLEAVVELQPLMPDFRQRLQAAGDDTRRRSALLRALYERAMTLPPVEVDALLNPLIARLEQDAPDDKDQPDFWAARAAREFPLPDGRRDRGIFSIYLLNLVRLKPGQATYQPAGTLHAYLEGVNMELMANSDNVLRGGLTPKHVDVPELMRILNFDSGHAQIIAGERVSPVETVYPTPAAEFELSRIQLEGDLASCEVDGQGPRIVLVLEGEVRVAAGDAASTLKRGEAVLLPHQQSCLFTKRTPTAVLFKAAMPTVALRRS
jgi:mannose-6-phosphate isomerase